MLRTMSVVPGLTGLRERVGRDFEVSDPGGPRFRTVGGKKEVKTESRVTPTGGLHICVDV